MKRIYIKPKILSIEIGIVDIIAASPNVSTKDGNYSNVSDDTETLKTEPGIATGGEANAKRHHFNAWETWD